MSLYVVDASVAAKWFAPEPHSEAALRVLAGAHELHAPDFFLLEMDSIVCKWIHSGLITPSEGDRIRQAIHRAPLQFHTVVSARDLAYSLANDTGRSTYDCLYLALAALLQCRMVTADRKLYDALAKGPFAQHVEWVETVA